MADHDTIILADPFVKNAHCRVPRRGGCSGCLRQTLESMGYIWEEFVRAVESGAAKNSGKKALANTPQRICALCEKLFTPWRESTQFCSYSCARRFLYPPTPERFWSHVNRTANAEDCWEWQGTRHPKGYGQIRWNGQGEKAHRLAWMLTYGEITDKALQVCHHCDCPPCCNPQHLFLGTNKDNSDDMWRKGRHPILKGEESGVARFMNEDIRRIRHLYADEQQAIASLARQYGCGESTIRNIVQRRTWRHIE
jgi:hypothetical protein